MSIPERGKLRITRESGYRDALVLACPTAKVN